MAAAWVAAEAVVWAPARSTAGAPTRAVRLCAVLLDLVCRVRVRAVYRARRPELRRRLHLCMCMFHSNFYYNFYACLQQSYPWICRPNGFHGP